MDHSEAITKGAVERYRLGELSMQEIEEFETHFFECAQCAEELRTAAIFEENAKAVFLEDRRSEAAAKEPRVKYERARASWWVLFWRNPWSAAPATIALAMLCVAAGEARIMQQMLVPQAVAGYGLLTFSRSEDHVVEVSKDDKFYLLYMDPVWEGSYQEYIFTVRDEKKVTRISKSIRAPRPGKQIQMLISRNELPSGHYTAIVRHPAANGQPESELASYSFILKLD